MLILPQARENVRALVGAAALGSTVGLAIGGAYLAGGLARATVVHAQMQRLAGAASGGFSDTALASSASGQDKAVLTIAQAHDPSAHASVSQGFAAAADADLKDRQVAALVDRLEARRAAREATPAPRVAQTVPAVVEAAAPVVMKASLTTQKAKSPGAEPFHLRGALDQSRDLECLTQAVYYEARGESQRRPAGGRPGDSQSRAPPRLPQIDLRGRFPGRERPAVASFHSLVTGRLVTIRRRTLAWKPISERWRPQAHRWTR